MAKPIRSRPAKPPRSRFNNPRPPAAARTIADRQLRAHVDNSTINGRTVDQLIREAQQTRLTLLHSTIRIARTLLDRARRSRSPKLITRSLQHAREEFELATRLLAANTMAPAQTASVRGELAALLAELQRTEQPGLLIEP